MDNNNGHGFVLTYSIANCQLLLIIIVKSGNKPLISNHCCGDKIQNDIFFD